MSTLYILATPIGNLEDITLRALRILKEVDFIICEDTRVTSKLLTRFEIQKPLMSHFQHSTDRKTDEIIARLREGKNAAFVTDAGTPGISDPGGMLVKWVYEKLGDEVKIVPIPGPSAIVAALSISGLPADAFLFLGFPPHKKGRQTFWKTVAACEETVVFYESPHRILKSLTELGAVLQGSPRAAVVCRELTKMFESVYRGDTDSILELVKKNPQKGEYVVVVGPK
ncbi:MAG: 16S rRNA (cytidine(1402)-2'-O)-methyltransferase [Patescibacteria group bacterium]